MVVVENDVALGGISLHLGAEMRTIGGMGAAMDLLVSLSQALSGDAKVVLDAAVKSLTQLCVCLARAQASAVSGHRFPSDLHTVVRSFGGYFTYLITN